MVTIKERLTTLELKVKVLIILVVAQMGIENFPFVSAEIIMPIVENITKLL